MNNEFSIGIFGACGRMGEALRSEASKVGVRVVELIERGDKADCNIGGVTVSTAPIGLADVYLDFTTGGAVAANAHACAEVSRPVVIGTTGLTTDDEQAIAEASARIAIVRDTNMSLGVTVLRGLIEQIKELRGVGYDVEIIERHHHFKLDSPSGTAASLLKIFEGAQLVHGRNGIKRRQEGEIGVHAIRAGGIYGDHTVLFASSDETIELKHSLISRSALAAGALKAAAFVFTAKPAVYTMADVWEKIKAASM